MRSSIEAMLSEVEYEIEQRNRVYPRIVAGNRSRAPELDLHLARMRDVREYLKEQLATAREDAARAGS